MSSDQDRWLHAMLRHQPAKASDACLDAETVAAWTEGALTGKELAAAELHASTCSRCTAILAATTQTAPPDAYEPTWPWLLVSPARWLVPLTAAATALAIWIAVPDRPITAPPARATDSPQPTIGSAEKSPALPPVAETNPADSYAPVPRPGSAQRQDLQRENQTESRRQRAEPDAERFAKLHDAASEPSPEAAPLPPVAESVPPAPPAAPSSAPVQARDSAAEPRSEPSALAAGNRALARESASVSTASSGWRIIAGIVVERSADGGKTWTRASPLPGYSTAASGIANATIRGVDAARAVVSIADGTVFYTTDAGKSWTRVQENQAAPF